MMGGMHVHDKVLMRDMVLILNYSDSSSRDIARSLRAEQVHCKIVPSSISLEEIEAQQPRGLIFAGGVTGGMLTGPDSRIINGSFPVLALGDAAAMLCRELGGDAHETAISNSIGAVSFHKCPLTENLDDCERMLYNVRRLRLPQGAVTLASSRDENVGFMLEGKMVYGVQFTLEQNDTDGMQLLLNFVLNVCGCSRWWNYDVFVENAIEEMQRVVGDGRAACAMTGGLDSSVSAMLAHKALGDRLQGIFIDTGLLRENEASRFMALYRDQLGLDIIHVQAQDRFMEALKGVVDPMEKRRIIGETLQKTLDEALEKLGEINMIVRGTTCADVLSGMNYKRRPSLRAKVPVMEPLRDLFRTEVRYVGELLDMPQETIQGQSFPGGGLALRIMGEISPARLQTLRAVDRIFSEEVAASGQGKRLKQYFAVLSPLAGDETRVMIALRAVQSTESTQPVYAARLPYDLLERTMDRILRERLEVTRVVYDITPSSRNAGVEWQ